ncbi:MAG: FecCD family ABC transporter permease [Anaerovoracaceae bacterium]
MINGKEEKGMSRTTRRWMLSFGILALLLAALLTANLRIGSVDVTWDEIFQVLAGEQKDGIMYSIIRELRLPRMCAAVLLGGALSVSGFLLQTYFRNPIAGPYVLGISSGSKMAVAVVMILCSTTAAVMSSWAMILAAFAGALLSMGMILLVSRVLKNMYMLVVGGIMIGYICTAVTDFLVTFAEDSNIVNLHNWSVGSFSGITWENVRVMALVTAIGTAAAFFMSKQMGAFLLGENYARSMGVSLGRFKTAVILLSSLLSACVTAFAGPVSFVGIAVPQIARQLMGTARPLVVIPACFLCGADFCLLCDLIARTAFAPVEINLSSVTAVFGAPVVLYVLIRGKERG